MNVNRQQLHQLIDIVDVNELDILYHILLKFVPEVDAAPDEVEAIAIGHAEFARGEYVSFDEIDWDAE